jgi:membrane fusion protein, multidrug efflux system
VLQTGQTSSPKPRRRRLWWIAAALIVLAGGDWAWEQGTFLPSKTARSAGANRKAGGGPVPVHAASVQKRDFPVILDGLGTVQPINTVTVRSRVDGQIVKVGFEEGEMVKQGDLLAQIDPAPFQAALDQAIAKLAQDQATLRNTKQDLERTTTLAKQGNATQQLLDQRVAAVASATALVQADEAAIEAAKVQLAYTTIRSPLTGRAGFRLVDPGNIVHANDQNGILTITQVEPIAVVFTAPEQEVPAITGAMKGGPLQVTASTSDGKTVLAKGTLRLIDNQVDLATGTIRLKASFDNKDRALWPGLSVTTRLLIKTIKDVVVVPDSAVQRGPNGLFAYVVRDNATAELRNLEVSRIEDGQALVDKGLAAGERIVTSGFYRVEPGGPVQVLDMQSSATAAEPHPAGSDRP